MDIIQVDSQTIKIKKSGFTFHLDYHYSWDKILRKPESIVLDGNKVNVFFPTSVQTDTITEHEKGFSVKRYWQIIPAGKISLLFTLDLLDYYSIPYFFPGLLSGDNVPGERIILKGERLSYPSSIFLFPGNKSIMISASIPGKPEDQGSISVGVVPVGAGKKLRTEIIYPPKEKLPRILANTEGFIEGPEENFFVSEGNLKKEIGFHVLIEQEKKIFSLAITRGHKRWRTLFNKQISFSKGEAQDIIRKGIEKTISTLGVNNQGIAGPKLSENTNSISASTTAGFACLLQRFFDTDLSLHETSLEYADFVLKAQHPRGIFFECFSLSSKEWELSCSDKNMIKENRSTIIKAPVASILHSAHISNYLLTLSEILEQKGCYNNKYFMAADKCINLFFDFKNKLIDFGSDFNMDTLTPEKQSLLSLEFIEPLIKIYNKTQKEKYKKAIKKIKEDFLFDDFLPHTLPALDSSEKPCFSTSLLLLKTVVNLIDSGFPIKNTDLFIHLILPWIYFNTSSSPAPFENVIGMIDSFSRNRLVFRGFECSYYFLRMAGLTEDKKAQKLLQDLAKDILTASKNVPIGTPWYQHALWSHNPAAKITQGLAGDFNSRAFVREAWYLLNIIDEFPGILQ
ncbi:MAG: hypothetical protein JXJ04_21805 [Spirochaetales bacterium]|nr:hypothetical protein [Spirochaetales bacterium]